MYKAKVLLVEDDETSSELYCDYLNENGFSVEPVFTATDCMAYVQNHSYDVLILDINLPDFSGIEILKSIKNHNPMPIIVVSAYNDTDLKLMAFKFGADDYMVKPIDIRELEARIWLQLKKSSKIEVDRENGIFKIVESNIFFDNKSLDLTLTEFEILSFLIKNRNKIVKREELSSSLRSINSHRSLDSHIKNIRKKISNIKNDKEYLKTVYGVGYKIDDECYS